MSFSTDDIRRFKQLFSQFDVDGNGSIDVQELGTMLTKLGEKCSREQLIQIIAEVDTNRSGTIEFDEFMTVMEKARKGVSTSKLGAVMGAKQALLAKAKENEPKKGWSVNHNNSMSIGRYSKGGGTPTL